MAENKENFIYMRIYGELRGEISSGALHPGERLGSELELKKAYGASRDTIRKALAKLEADGLVSRRPALGTFVTASKANYAPRAFHESFSEQMRKLGRVPSSDVLSIEILTEVDKGIADALALRPGEKVYRIRRIRKADSEPMAYEVVCLRERFCPNIHTLIYNDSSLYEIYEQHYHLKMGTIEIGIEAELADAQIQKLLHLRGPSALLTMTSVMYLENGEPFYHVVSYHIGEKYVFKTRLPRTTG